MFEQVISIVWHLEHINWDSEPFKAAIRVVTNFTVHIGDSLCYETIIIPVTGDADTTNNREAVCFVTVASLDPNNKLVNPEGNCAEGYVSKNQALKYTINFQNVGTAEAENVVILDTLDAALDLSSLRVIGASHAMVTEVLPGPVLRFRFDNIFLPDSTSDEAGSQGFVLFELTPLSSVPENTLPPANS